MIKVEGIATIDNGSFRFDSILPSNETVLDEPLKMRGTMKVSENACVEFQDERRLSLPPEIICVSEGQGYRVKRTSRHYLLQLKVPVVENRAETEDRIVDMMARALGDITLDRKELFNNLVA